MVSFHKLIPPAKYLLLELFLVLPSLGITQGKPQYAREKDALYALKTDFNHTFLSRNWTGLRCCSDKAESSWFGIGCENGRVTEILLEDMGLAGKVNVHALFNLTELSSLSLKNNTIAGNVMDFTLCKKLRRIDLSDNMFEGRISSSLLGLDVLESLLLQGNNLTGSIPEFNQQSLTELNVSNNNLFGEIPQTQVLQSFALSSYIGNEGLCGHSTLNACDRRGGRRLTLSSEADTATGTGTGTGTGTVKRKNTFWTNAVLVALFVVLDITGLAIVIFLFCLYYKKVKTNKKEVKAKEVVVIVQDDKQNGSCADIVTVAPKADEERKLTFLDELDYFELSDLLRASAEGLGKGNFGNVYKAKLENGLEVVVKRLRDLKPLTDHEFATQMRALADLKHPNLLSPLAYYYSKDDKLIVHKFVPNGNLFSRLFGRRGKDRVPFRWNSRLYVAQCVARALEFLHQTSSQTTIPHGNLKSTNILLDANEMAIVSDYGLVSLIAQPISVQRMTSFKCPEYQSRKKISKKADVWNYGSLLLELLTGKISTYSAPQGINGVDLSSWVHKAVREEWTAEIFDLEISTTQTNAAGGMLRLLQIALKCCDKSPDKRLDMEVVVREVEEIKICDSEEDSDISLERSMSTEDSESTNPRPRKVRVRL